MSQQTLVIIMEGGEPANTPIARQMRELRDRLTVEAIQQLRACQNIFLMVCTNRACIQEYCQEHQIPFYDTGSDNQSLTPFHYLASIQHICKKCSSVTISSAIVLGGAALPLAQKNDYQRLIDSLQDSRHSVWANNPISPDVVGWTPIERIECIKSVQNDNELAAALRDQARLHYQMWPRTLTYSYDIDTPLDWWIAVRQGTNRQQSPIYVGDDTKERFTNVEQAILNFLNGIHKQKLPTITLIGRVSPQTVQYLNQTVKARVRCFSEERGMKGLQRDKQGKVWSLVADWFERFASYEEAFDQLAYESDAIFMDTRVWMAHHRLVLAEEDRFASDLLLDERIGNQKLRQFTQAARTCNVPVLLGGFGLVNQGIQLLLQTASNG